MKTASQLVLLELEVLLLMIIKNNLNIEIRIINKKDIKQQDFKEEQWWMIIKIKVVHFKLKIRINNIKIEEVLIIMIVKQQ